MSEATGQPAEGQTTGGGSILTEGVGTPQGNQLDTSQQTTTPAAGERPAYLSERFWKDGKADVEALATSYTSLERLLGSEKVPVPKSWEDKEAADRWYKAAGRPDDINGYEFEKPEKLPEGFYDDTAEAAARQWFHENGLNKTQAKNLHAAFVKTNLERHAAYQDQQRQAQEQVKAALIREHGKEYEGFEKAAKAAIAKFADPDYIKWLDESGAGNDPRMIRAWGRIGKSMMGETTLKGTPPVSINAGDIEKQISDLRRTNSDALNNKTHPDHARIMAEMTKLYAQRFPDQQA